MIRSAVIGVGYLGRFHAEKYAKLKTSELVAVVDTDEKRASKIARKFKAAAYTDVRQLEGLGVQCASVVSDTSTHYEIAKWLLEHGIDVLVEKPMTVAAEEARSLIDIAARNDRILQVGHLERFNPAFRSLQSILTKPWFFEVRRIAPFSGRGIDVDVVRDLMIHDIDIVSHLVGKPVKRIEAVGVPVLTESVDIANARITFEGGAIANFTASRAALKSERTIRIFQPEMYISMDFEKKRLKIYNKTAQKDATGFPKISVTEHRVQERDALEHEIDSFLQSVLTRSAPEVTGHDGLRALQLTDQIHQAFRQSMDELSLDEQRSVAANQVGNAS